MTSRNRLKKRHNDRIELASRLGIKHAKYASSLRTSMEKDGFEQNNSMMNSIDNGISEVLQNISIYHNHSKDQSILSNNYSFIPKNTGRSHKTTNNVAINPAENIDYQSGL